MRTPLALIFLAIDRALNQQADIAAPSWIAGLSKDAKNPDGKSPGKPMLAALGDVREKGDEMLVAYSVMNTTDHWIEVLPPQVELNSPNLYSDKEKDKKRARQTLAEQVLVTDYRLNARRLAPGERADGAVEFSRPSFKQSKDRLLPQLATASEVDDPLLLQVPFVPPGSSWLACFVRFHSLEVNHGQTRKYTDRGTARQSCAHHGP